jgi:hypothetical protein
LPPRRRPGVVRRDIEKGFRFLDGLFQTGIGLLVHGDTQWYARVDILEKSSGDSTLIFINLPALSLR